MRTTLLVLLVAACSSSPGAPRAGTAAAPAVPELAVVPIAVVPVAAAPPHRCQKSVWPVYAAYAETDPEPVPEEVDPDAAAADQEMFDEMGGASLEDKLAAINETRPSAGVCDTRHAEALETSILKQRTPRPATAAPMPWDHRSCL